MFDALITLLLPAFLTAISILLTILLKGDICPGQRGRIHKWLPVLGVIGLATSYQSPLVLVSVVLVGFFYTKVKTSKTRDKGPTWALMLSVFVAALAFAIDVISLDSWLAGMAQLVCGALLGLSLTHSLLLLARSRLDAFHRILPLGGLALAILITLLLLPKANGLQPDELNASLHDILSSMGCMVTAIIVWAWHMLKVEKPTKTQLMTVLAVLAFAMSRYFHWYIN